MPVISPPKCAICGAQHWSYERHHVAAKPAQTSIDPLIAKREAQNKYQRDYQRRKREARQNATDTTDRPRRADQAEDQGKAPEVSPTHH